MSSNITYLNIDESFPVAGVDNSSQGFRDNFSAIKNSLEAAKAEMEDLQNKAVLKSALTGGALLNDLEGNSIINANLSGYTELCNQGGNINTVQSVNFAYGHYQVFTVQTTVELILTGWPETGVKASMEVHLYGTNDSSLHVITVSAGGGTIKYSDDWPNPLYTAPFGESIILEFWTYNGGSTIFAKYKGTFS